MKDIVVIDNFFDEKEFKVLKNFLDKISFTPLIYKETGDSYGFGHSFKKIEENEWLFSKIKNSLIKDKNLILSESSFRLRHNFKKALPHNDKDFANYSFICYLKGKELMYNGTGFYNNKKNLDRYIGFKENRAVFFNSEIFHTDLQALGESSPRYSLNIFYKNQEKQ